MNKGEARWARWENQNSRVGVRSENEGEARIEGERIDGKVERKRLIVEMTDWTRQRKTSVRPEDRMKDKIRLGD